MNWAQGIALFIALIFVGLLGRGIRRRQLSLIRGLVFATIATAAGIYAWVPHILELLDRIPYLTRIRLLMGLISFVVFFVTIESIRRNLIEERYALLWVLTSILLLLCAIFVRVLDFFCHLLGMQYVTFVVTVIFTFLLLLCFHFSAEFSRLVSDRTKLAQRIGLLQARVEQLERKLETIELKRTQLKGAAGELDPLATDNTVIRKQQDIMATRSEKLDSMP